MLCSKCGTHIDPEDKFCKSCGEVVHTSPSQETSVTSEVGPGFDPLLNPSNKKSRKSLWITAAAVVVVLGGGTTAFASTFHVFSSGKTLITDAIAHQTNNMDASSAETWNIKLKNLSASNLPPTEAALLSTLNNATIDLNVLYSPKDKKAQLDFNTQYQSVNHHGSVWVSSNAVVLSAADYQSLLVSILPQGIKLPQYLVTDSDQAKSISDFWAQLDKSRANMTADQSKAMQQVEALLIAAIPDKYIHRKGLMTVEIQFDQTGLADILTSEVKNVYDHKQEFVDAISQVASATPSLPSGMNASSLKQSMLDGLNQMPEEAVLAGISTVLNAGILSTEPMTISVTKGLFGSNLTEKVSGGLSFKDPQSNTSATVEFTVNSNSPAETTVQMPTVKSGNSETFANFSAQADKAATTTN